MVEKKGGINSRSLKAALDSSPLWGAAKVEDTYNLLGHALRKALKIIAEQKNQELGAIASQSGADIMVGSSLKAALDLDWDDPQAKTEALTTIIQTLNNLELWVEQEADLPDQTIEKAKKKSGYSQTLLLHKMWKKMKMATLSFVRGWLKTDALL